MRTRSWMTAGLLAAAIAAASGATLSQGGPGGYGPGMMGGGYGPGMMGGNHGPGMMGGGYGPGMMGGGHGPGMMGGGYGPGMMGGGYGRGMMGGGYGPGMMGGGYGPGMMGGYAALELTDEQRQKLAALGEQARRRNWEAMGQLQAEQFKLRELLRADPVSASAVVEQQGKVDEVRRQVLKSRVETRNEMATVLTPEQRRKLHDAGPWWYREDAE